MRYDIHNLSLLLHTSYLSQHGDVIYMIASYYYSPAIHHSMVMWSTYKSSLFQHTSYLSQYGDVIYIIARYYYTPAIYHSLGFLLKLSR